MKVLHINTIQQGGAAWCAIRICKALQQEGVECRMLFAEGNSLPKGIEGAIAQQDSSLWRRNRYTRKIKNLLSKLPIPGPMDADRLKYKIKRLNTQHLYLHQPLSNYKNISHHPLMEWADIIHLHWVADFVDYPTFFRNVKKPIVWTLHDKYPAMGVQHYSSEFFPVPQKLQEMDAYCKRIKRNGVLKAKNLNIVAISETMKDICKHSDVLTGFPITLIHNGVDANSFQMYERSMARKELGLLPDATIFLFSGYSISDSNKGLDRVIQALEKSKVPNRMLVCIGNVPYNQPLPSVSFPIILSGMLDGQERIAKYYSAADIFLLASYEETFAQTPLEAMACGTPVVSTPCSGASDLINEKNGVLCKGFDSDVIAEGIREAMGKTYDRQTIREDVIARFSYDKIAKEYIKLYEEVLAKI